MMADIQLLDLCGLKFHGGRESVDFSLKEGLIAKERKIFSVLMNTILSVMSATELFCKDSVAKQKRHVSIYRNKVFPRTEHFSRHYHRRTCDEVQQQTEKYFDCLETRWSKLLPIESYSATNNSRINKIQDKPVTTNEQNLLEYDELMHNNGKDENVLNNNDIVNGELTTKKSHWLWLQRFKNRSKISMAKSKSTKLKQDNPWNRLHILNLTNELTNNINTNKEYLTSTNQSPPLNKIYTNTDSLVAKNNDISKTLLLRQFKNSQSKNIILPGLNEKIPYSGTPSQTLYSMAQFDFFWPQKLPAEQITATSEYTPTEMNSPLFWKKESKQNRLTKQKNDNLKTKETSSNLNNLYRNYFLPITVIPTLKNSFKNNVYQISNLSMDSEFQLSKDIPKFPYYTISIDQLERILHRYSTTTTRKPLSLINNYGPMSYFISNQKLAPQIVQAMRHLDKTVLNYPARVHYDLYKIPSSLETNINNQRKNVTDVLNQIISATRFQNNDNYK